MNEKILSELNKIEKDNEVKILYAVESGSRAWGFASTDSDYDVRFIYAHPRDWYLTVQEKRDVIEIPIEGDLDINGWDIRKALGLMIKSNPPLLEWIGSPIVYIGNDTFVNDFREVAKAVFRNKSCCYHYLSMVRSNFHDYLQDDMVKVKKYFYVLRPLFAFEWIVSKNEMAPTEFSKLLTLDTIPKEVLSTINDLLIKKRSGVEMDKEPRIELLNNFITERLVSNEKVVENLSQEKIENYEMVDNLFRKYIDF